MSNIQVINPALASVRHFFSSDEKLALMLKGISSAFKSSYSMVCVKTLKPEGQDRKTDKDFVLPADATGELTDVDTRN